MHFIHDRVAEGRGGEGVTSPVEIGCVIDDRVARLGNLLATTGVLLVGAAVEEILVLLTGGGARDINRPDATCSFGEQWRGCRGEAIELAGDSHGGRVRCPNAKCHAAAI